MRVARSKLFHSEHDDKTWLDKLRTRVGLFKCRSQRFCERWAELNSSYWDISFRREDLWTYDGGKVYRAEYYDLAKYNGWYVHHNGHDVGFAEGATVPETWKDLERKILKFERVSSRTAALMLAELRALGREEPSEETVKAWQSLAEKSVLTHDD